MLTPDALRRDRAAPGAGRRKINQHELPCGGHLQAEMTEKTPLRLFYESAFLAYEGTFLAAAKAQIVADGESDRVPDARIIAETRNVMSSFLEKATDAQFADFFGDDAPPPEPEPDGFELILAAVDPAHFALRH